MEFISVSSHHATILLFVVVSVDVRLLVSVQLISARARPRAIYFEEHVARIHQHLGLHLHNEGENNWQEAANASANISPANISPETSQK